MTPRRFDDVCWLGMAHVDRHLLMLLGNDDGTTTVACMLPWFFPFPHLFTIPQVYRGQASRIEFPHIYGTTWDAERLDKDGRWPELAGYNFLAHVDFRQASWCDPDFGGFDADYRPTVFPHWVGYERGSRTWWVRYKDAQPRQGQLYP